MANKLNLKTEAGILLGEKKSGKGVFNKVEIAEARIAAEALCDHGKKLITTAEAMIKAYSDRLDDPRLPDLADGLGKILIDSAEDSVFAMRSFNNLARKQISLVSKLGPRGFPTFSLDLLSAEFETIDMTLDGVSPFRR